MNEDEDNGISIADEAAAEFTKLHVEKEIVSLVYCVYPCHAHFSSLGSMVYPSRKVLTLNSNPAEGYRAVPLSVKNHGIVLEELSQKNKVKIIVVNRIEVNTAMDFSKIIQIMVSDPISYPYKPGYAYVHVVCLTDKPLPLLIPYIYPERVSTTPTTITTPDHPPIIQIASGPSGGVVLENNLKEWIFVNIKSQSARHHIQHYVKQ